MENKSNCIARCLLCITTGIITFMGFIYFIWKISPCYQSNDYWGLLFTLSIVGFILLTVSVCSLIYYYFRKDATRKFDTILDKIGSDITHIFSWLFSVNGFLFIILCAIVALVCFFICRFWNICGCCSGNNIQELQLTALTLTISLAAIIPTIITKIIAQKEIESVVDKKLDQKRRTDKKTIKKNLETAHKNTAHSSRMNANILFQIADQQKRDADTLTDTNAKELLYEKALENYFWAIGWGAKAIAQYFFIIESYPEGITTFCTEIIEFLDVLKKKISGEEEFEKLKNKNVRRRDLKSVIQAHAFIRIHEDVAFKRKKDGHPINVERMLKDVELLLMKFGASVPNAEECKMKELNDRDNEELVEEARKIIEIKAKEEAKKKAEEEAYKRMIEDSRKRVDAIVSSSKDKKESTDTEEQTEQRPDIWY